MKKNFVYYTYCEKCGAESPIDDSIVYTSIPPMYQYVCPRCGHVDYVHCVNAKVEPSKDNEKNQADEICDDNRFKIIQKAKDHLLERTNIESSPEEMEVLDNFLFRCWQMGWLKQYEK